MNANPSNLLSAGIYAIPEASRLTGVSSARIRRWLKGYDFKTKKDRRHSKPVWSGQLAPLKDRIAVGFKDLMEIRYVAAFLDVGVSWKTMRQAHESAKSKLSTDHPFCSHRFATDGRSILLQEAHSTGDTRLIDIATDQCEFERIVTPFLRELDLLDGGIARWWPLGKDRLVVVDPVKNMGQPTTLNSGVPTKVLARSLKTNGSVESVARWYEVSVKEIEDAVEFEQKLAA